MATNKELEKQIADLTELVGMAINKQTANASAPSRPSNKRHSAMLIKFVGSDPVPVTAEEAKASPDGIYVSYAWKKGEFNARKDRTRRIPLSLYLEGYDNSKGIFDALK